MLVDSHCHLDRLDLSPYEGDLAAALEAARCRGVSRFLCIGIDLANAGAVIDIARGFADVSASVGVHPMDVKPESVDWLKFEQFAGDPEVVAIGETGLDYYYSEDSREHQKESFKRHLQLASRLQKPSIVHSRDAREDTLGLIRSSGDASVGGVLHCFTETWEMASRALDLNYLISFSGIISFNNAAPLREVVKRVPLEKMLIETDSPYLAPVPYRGRKNEPRYVYEVAQCVADIKGISIEEVAETTSKNFNNLFF